MTELPLWSYLGIFAASASLAILVTPAIMGYALRRGHLDRPGGHKAHGSPVPYLGGLSLVVAFSAVVLIAAVLRPPASGLGELGIIFGLALGLSALGLVDDLRGASVWWRLAVEVAAALVLWSIGSGVGIFDIGLLDALVTVIWVVGIMNSVNFLDNMDGLSAGVAAIAGAAFCVIALANGQYLVGALAAAVSGCAFGFLRHNFHPAQIYMGDAGSLFLGFLLAFLGIRLRFEGPTEVTFFVPILVLGVAIFDTTIVTVNRLLHRRSPLAGGRDHVSHRLVFIGIPVPAAVSLIYAGAVATGWLGLIMSRVDLSTGLLLMSWILSVAAFMGVLLSLVPVYENSSRRRLMLQEVRDHEPEGSAGP